MKLSELVAKLQNTIDETGDLPGYTWNADNQSYFPVDSVEIIDDPFAFVFIYSECDEGEIHPPRRQ